MLYTYLPRILTGLLAIVQSANLRNRVYAMEDRLDILEVAIEDIERINANSANPNALISNIVHTVAEHKARLADHYR